MIPANVPPLPRARQPLFVSALVPFSIIVAAFVALIVGLRLAGLLIPYRVPSAAMHPSIQAGDQIVMEGITWRWGKLSRGDMIVFRTKGIPNLPETTYVKRLVGFPGERLRIINGRVHVNGSPVGLTASTGDKIDYTNAGLLRASAEFQVPPGHFFVLGDNSRNSADSRYWGALPQTNVQGKIWFRYWPPR